MTAAEHIALIPRHGITRRLTSKLCDVFELGDHEYIRFSFQHHPWSFWLTILEERRRCGWRRVMPWRIRFAWASLLRQRVFSRCTLCSTSFKLRELLARPGDLMYFPSGSICHRTCSNLMRSAWICPRCDCSNAPHVDYCECSPVANARPQAVSGSYYDNARPDGALNPIASLQDRLARENHMVKLALFALLALPLSAQVQRVAIIDVALKPQAKGVWSVTLSTDAPFPVQVSRAKILVRAPAVSQLTRDQTVNQQNNSGFAVIGRTGRELLSIAPAGLSAAGIATQRQSLGWYGLGLSLAMYFVDRAVARSQPVGTELPDLIALPASGGAEFVLHATRIKNPQPVVFQIQVSSP